jgi:hypothetical protein
MAKTDGKTKSGNRRALKQAEKQKAETAEK